MLTAPSTEREIRQFHVVAVQRWQGNVKNWKRDARAKLLFCLLNLLLFLVLVTVAVVFA